MLQAVFKITHILPKMTQNVTNSFLKHSKKCENYPICSRQFPKTAKKYSGDPKTGHVRISNGQPCPDFEWRSDFKWSF